MDPEKLPVPLPPEPESPKGFKALLQHQRFILVTLVVLLFFGILFGLGLYRKAKTVTPGETAFDHTITDGCATTSGIINLGIAGSNRIPPENSINNLGVGITIIKTTPCGPTGCIVGNGHV